MTDQARGYPHDEAALRGRIGLALMALAAEVNRMRAMRSDGREDRFAGLFMSDGDVADLTAQLLAAPLPGGAALDAALADATARHAARLSMTEGLPRIERLIALYGLDAIEQAVFVTALAARIDPRVGRVLGYLSEDLAQAHLTPALAARLAPGGGAAPLEALWRVLGQDGTLRRYGLVAVEGQGGAARIEVPAAVADLLVAGPDEGLRAARLPLPGAAGHGPATMIEAARDLDAVAVLGRAGPLWLGPDPALDLAATLAGETRVTTGCDGAEVDARRRVARRMTRGAVLVTRDAALWQGLGVPFNVVVAPPADRAARHALWSALVKDEAAAILTDADRGDPGALWRLALETPDTGSLAQALRARSRAPMRGVAAPVAARWRLDDLVLPDRLLARLRGFAARAGGGDQVLGDWGLGATLGARAGGVALFLGASGTGKTMAASAVAEAAGRDLWRVDLARVVSKYIGETEANLDRVLTAADEAGVMLFFDEAEALFSKRAEVRDARDRYANMEMAYLLQRIEDYAGWAVLASNMGGTLEPAMLRRFDLVLDFPVPDAVLRRALWGRIEAARVPLAGDVDLAALADRFELAGGHIRQAILDAAHEAAAEGCVVGQAHLLRGVARELTKLGRPIRREDFGAHFAALRGNG